MIKLRYNRNTRILLWLVLLTFVFQEAFSTTIKIHGIVKDSQTNEVLVFTSLGLKKYPIGTCTNKFGEFQLLVDDSLVNEMLTVSEIGYESKEYKISEMNNNYFEIMLVPKTIQLDEVQVLPPITAEELLRKVIKNHSKNYPFGFCFYDVFFRDLVTDDSPKAKIKNCRLTEAAVNMEEFGLDSYREPKFKVHEIRNSYNYVETSKLTKLMAFWGLLNPLSWIYSYEDLISRNKLKKLLKNDCYSKEILDLTEYEGSPVYRLELREKYVKYMGITANCTRAYSSIILYVNAKNWAVQEAKKTWMLKIDSLNGEFRPEGYVLLKMQKFNDQYYLKLIDYDGGIGDEYFKFGEDFDYKHKTTILVNDVILDRKSIERIRLRNAMKTDQPLWNIEYKYNPEFWKSYNVLLDSPIDPSIKVDLERESPLDEQYKDGGTKNAKKPTY